MNEFEGGTSPFAEPSGGDISSIDADAVLAQIEAGGDVGTPATGGEGQAQTQQPDPTKTPAATPPGAQELEFTWNGKQIKLPITDPRAKQWLGQGYDYAQRIEQFKTEQTAFQKQQEAVKALQSRYSELEAYAEKNPGWIDQVNAAYLQAKEQQLAGQSGAQQADPNNPLVREINALKSQVSEVLKFKADSETQLKTSRQKEEDQTLSGDIQSVRDQFKDLDWNALSPDGQSMEAQVLNFAQENNIGLKADGSYTKGGFQQAFKLYNHDRLMKLAEDRAKESAVKERQRQTKLGLLGQSSTPKRGITHVEDLKNKSWDDVYKEALVETGLA